MPGATQGYSWPLTGVTPWHCAHHAKSRHTAPVRAHTGSPGTTAPKSAGSGREQRATGCAAGRPRRSDVVVRGQARPEGVRYRSRVAGQRAADGKKFGFWAPYPREAASCCPSRNLGAATEIDGAAGARACGGRGLASPSMRAVSSGMLDIKVDVCKTDELDGRVDGVRASSSGRSADACMVVKHS